MSETSESWTFHLQDDLLLLRLAAIPQKAEQEAIRLELDGLIENSQIEKLYLDLTAMSWLDSSGLGWLVSLGMTLRKKEVDMAILLGNQSSITYLFNIAQICLVFNIIEERQALLDILQIFDCQPAS